MEDKKRRHRGAGCVEAVLENAALLVTFSCVVEVFSHIGKCLRSTVCATLGQSKVAELAHAHILSSLQQFTDYPCQTSSAMQLWHLIGRPMQVLAFHLRAPLPELPRLIAPCCALVFAVAWAFWRLMFGRSLSYRAIMSYLAVMALNDTIIPSAVLFIAPNRLTTHSHHILPDLYTGPLLAAFLWLPARFVMFYSSITVLAVAISCLALSQGATSPEPQQLQHLLRSSIAAGLLSCLYATARTQIWSAISLGLSNWSAMSRRIIAAQRVRCCCCRPAESCGELPQQQRLCQPAETEPKSGQYDTPLSEASAAPSPGRSSHATKGGGVAVGAAARQSQPQSVHNPARSGGTEGLPGEVSGTAGGGSGAAVSPSTAAANVDVLLGPEPQPLRLVSEGARGRLGLMAGRADRRRWSRSECRQGPVLQRESGRPDCLEAQSAAIISGDELMSISSSHSSSSSRVPLRSEVPCTQPWRAPAAVPCALAPDIAAPAAEDALRRSSCSSAASCYRGGTTCDCCCSHWRGRFRCRCGPTTAVAALASSSGPAAPSGPVSADLAAQVHQHVPELRVRRIKPPHLEGHANILAYERGFMDPDSDLDLDLDWWLWEGSAQTPHGSTPRWHHQHQHQQQQQQQQSPAGAATSEAGAMAGGLRDGIQSAHLCCPGPVLCKGGGGGGVPATTAPQIIGAATPPPLPPLPPPLGLLNGQDPSMPPPPGAGRCSPGGQWGRGCRGVSSDGSDTAAASTVAGCCDRCERDGRCRGGAGSAATSWELSPLDFARSLMAAAAECEYVGAMALRRVVIQVPEQMASSTNLLYGWPEVMREELAKRHPGWHLLNACVRRENRDVRTEEQPEQLPQPGHEAVRGQ
ncbi:hypothetical protein VaNZ11_005590 [Volvox africanus]|uniref:Uncharacterized protein n=1 Tax=Volvox africanus TaxID=51714 RepID=A0ABQ5RZ41_9CHLO|nr:hypothetical protein VaNZ11_005590 [Volvox africanus]